MQIERDVVLAGRYRLEQCLGYGGMGSVWRAVDLRLDRSVAVKLASASPDSSAGPGRSRRRLRREAAALVALSEPHIARVYDLVESDRDVCLVMELVEGESLAERLSRQPRLTAREALEITGQCAQALQAAHRIGIVHRDVKPSNIMLGPDGVKVVDFGIAAHIGLADGETTMTMPRSVMGTAAYLAPERALGASAGAEADFYSLGVVLYQMLSMHLPFHADESLAMLYAHTRATPEPLPADVPAPAAELCLRMLSKKPEQRPTSVRDIRAARDALSGERDDALAAVSIDLRTEPLEVVPRRRVRRRGTTALLGALSSATVVLAAVTAWFVLDQPATAGAGSPMSAPTSASAPAVVIPPSAGQVSAYPVAKATPIPKATPTHRSPAKQRRHSGGDKHGKYGHGTDQSGPTDNGGDGGGD